MGQWLAANIDPETPVASFDIGGIGYFSHSRIVDLGGLTDPAFVPYLLGGRVQDYLREYHIHWMVLPAGTPGESDCGIADALGLDTQHGFDKQMVESFSSPWDIWMIGHSATGHACQGQTLYRIGS